MLGQRTINPGSGLTFTPTLAKSVSPPERGTAVSLTRLASKRNLLSSTFFRLIKVHDCGEHPGTRHHLNLVRNRVVMSVVKLTFRILQNLLDIFVIPPTKRSQSSNPDT